jgi:hypothetical protein
MAGTWAAVACAIAVAGGTSTALAAEPLTVATVVLHVRDYQKVSPRRLIQAESLAARVYARIGVRLLWTDGNAREARADGNFHLDVVILTEAMTAVGLADPLAFGKASRITRRASIFYARIVEHARHTKSDPDRALALVLAHEIGHMLLPEDSHTDSGLMQARWTRRIVTIPAFLPAQAIAIRAKLATPDIADAH